MELREISLHMRAIIDALNNLEVKGRQNLDILLGSMQTLERLAVQLNQQAQKVQKEEPEIKLDMVPEDDPTAE